MEREEHGRPVRVMCHNCHRETIGWQDGTGRTKVQCSICGTITVSKVMSRRHVQLDIFAPKGQEILNDDT